MNPPQTSAQQQFESVNAAAAQKAAQIAAAEQEKAVQDTAHEHQAAAPSEASVVTQPSDEHPAPPPPVTEVKPAAPVDRWADRPPSLNGSDRSSSAVTGANEPSVSVPQKPFGDLQVKVESLRLLSEDNHSGTVILTLIIANTSASKIYGVALNPDYYSKFNLYNSRGDQFRVSEVSGINTAFKSYDGFRGSLTDIQPKSSITIVAKGWAVMPGKLNGIYAVCRGDEINDHGKKDRIN